MPTHFDITSIARRLDAGTYSPAIARRPRPALVAPPATAMRIAEVLAAGIMGGVIGFMLGGGLS